MKVALDTNVVLDVLADRAEFAEAATAIFYQVETGKVQGILCATTFTTLHYLLSKSQSTKVANQSVKKLLQLFEIAPVTRRVLELASESKQADYEDAVLAIAAALAGADLVITRNPRDFLRGPLQVLTPTEWLVENLTR